MSSSPSIIGHDLQRDALMHDLENGNVSHAYLFSGIRHLGKFTIAKWFAKMLLTDGITDPDAVKAAGDQVDRLLHQALLVLDQLWIEDVCEDVSVIAKTSNVPQQHRAKAHARTDTIGIDDVRGLQERLHEVNDGYRCCLIRSVERMQDEAVNALLKILEEPPPGVVFLLTTQSLPSLLPTLVSRTRVLRFHRLPTAQLRPLLKNVPGDDAGFLLHVAQGAPGIVRMLAADPEKLRVERTMHAAAVSFWQSPSLATRMQTLKPLHERTDEADTLLLHLALALRERSHEPDLRSVEAFHTLIRNFRTNVSRQMLVQQFVLAAEK